MVNFIFLPNLLGVYRKKLTQKCICTIFQTYSLCLCFVILTNQALFSIIRWVVKLDFSLTSICINQCVLFWSIFEFWICCLWIDKLEVLGQFRLCTICNIVHTLCQNGLLSQCIVNCLRVPYKEEKITFREHNNFEIKESTFPQFHQLWQWPIGFWLLSSIHNQHSSHTGWWQRLQSLLH